MSKHCRPSVSPPPTSAIDTVRSITDKITDGMNTLEMRINEEVGGLAKKVDDGLDKVWKLELEGARKPFRRDLAEAEDPLLGA